MCYSNLGLISECSFNLVLYSMLVLKVEGICLVDTVSSVSKCLSCFTDLTICLGWRPSWFRRKKLTSGELARARSLRNVNKMFTYNAGRALDTCHTSLVWIIYLRGYIFTRRSMNCPGAILNVFRSCRCDGGVTQRAFCFVNPIVLGREVQRLYCPMSW